MINAKPKGKCPFCLKLMVPKVLEENTLRRDKCQCSFCSKIVYICRMPGCNNYTKGGDYYDDEFCPDCQESFSTDTSDSSSDNTSNKSHATAEGIKDSKLSQQSTTRDMVKDKGNKLEQKAEASKSFDNNGSVENISDLSGGDSDGLGILDILSSIAD